MATSAIKSTKYVAGKAFMGDRPYEAGDPVSAEYINSLPDHKVGQFLNQRILELAAASVTPPG